MSITTIKDTRVAVRPSKELLQLIEQNAKHISELPENIAKALKNAGFIVPSKIEILKPDDNNLKVPNIDMKLLSKVRDHVKLKQKEDKGKDMTTEKETKDKTKMEKSQEEELEQNVDKHTNATTTAKEKTKKVNEEKPRKQEVCFFLSDLIWLNNFLAQLRKEQGLDVYMYKLYETCSLELPKNEFIERNPELEARCQKLREQQQNREYLKMTKNVDAGLKRFPEDTIAYQMKAMNSQIIAVMQFVFSVVAGFVFGFLGVELIIGNLDFGFRLLLGIMCALIIALAEIYFLAKKLSEYDEIPPIPNFAGTPKKSKKMHSD